MKFDVCGLIVWCESLGIGAGCGACSPLSESVSEPAAGFNGGFEVVREGERALRFDVAACGDEGGRRSPGLAREIGVEPGATYAVSFQVECEGSRWSAAWGGVDAKTGELEPSDTSPCDEGEWRRVEQRYTVPERFGRLRFQFNVLSPGRMWLDDVRIERVGTQRSKVAAASTAGSCSAASDDSRPHRARCPANARCARFPPGSSRHRDSR